MNNFYQYFTIYPPWSFFIPSTWLSKTGVLWKIAYTRFLSIFMRVRFIACYIKVAAVMPNVGKAVMKDICPPQFLHRNFIMPYFYELIHCSISFQYVFPNQCILT